VLDTDEDRLIEVEDLTALGCFDGSTSEIIAAAPTVGGRVFDGVVGVGPHRQVRTWRTGLLSPVALHVTVALRLCLGSPLRSGLARFRFVLDRIR
jgi:hypothetical protein